MQAVAGKAANPGGRLTLILAAFVFALNFARADDDSSDPGFEKYLLQNHYGPILTRGEGNAQFFDAKINGKKVHFKIDSGAESTVISSECADRLGLAVKDTGRVGTGVGGKTSGDTGVAQISSFTINDWPLNRLSTIFVLPPSGHLPEADGLFGFEYLRMNAAVMVVGGAGILIRPGPLSQAPHLESFLSKKGFRPVPLIIFKNRLLVDGTINGHPLHAQVDCGAQYSFFQLPFVRSYARPAYGNIQMRGVDGREMDGEMFEPKEISLGSFEAKPEQMVVAYSPLLDANHLDALIGFDFLSTHHAVLDAGSATLWLK